MKVQNFFLLFLLMIDFSCVYCSSKDKKKGARRVSFGADVKDNDRKYQDVAEAKYSDEKNEEAEKEFVNDVHNNKSVHPAEQKIATMRDLHVFSQWHAQRKAKDIKRLNDEQREQAFYKNSFSSSSCAAKDDKA
jgi:hypothetical protein